MGKQLNPLTHNSLLGSVQEACGEDFNQDTHIKALTQSLHEKGAQGTATVQK